MLLWVCKVIDHEDNVVKTSVTHLPVPWVPLSCSYYILMSSVMSFDNITEQTHCNLESIC